MFCHPWARTGYHQTAYTEFEVTICTQYEDMKKDAKCRKWGGLGVVKVTQDH